MSRIRRALGNRDLYVVEFKEKTARLAAEELGLSPSTGTYQNHPVVVVTHYRGKPLRTFAQARHVSRIVGTEIARLNQRDQKKAREKAKIRKDRAVRKGARIRFKLLFAETT